MGDLNPSDFSVINTLQEPTWINYPVVSARINQPTFFADIINHYAGRLSYPDKMTVAHETTHMINNDIRNSHGLGFSGGGFYVGGNKSFVVGSPPFRKSQVGNFVPKTLRASRFNTYITGSASWDDNPLYIFDEWIAYVSGAAAAIEDVKLGTYPKMVGSIDAVMGPLEFAVYAAATILAIRQFSPQYLIDNADFMRYTEWTLRRSFEVFNEGRRMPEFQWSQQESYIVEIGKHREIYNIIKNAGAPIL